MSDNFLGEIRPFAFNFYPTGWLFCAGQLLPITQYTALFSLLGTQYGGDGRSNFGLPDLRSRVAIGAGSGPSLSTYLQGETFGVESVALGITQIPAHNHLVPASSSLGTTSDPTQGVFAVPNVDPRMQALYSDLPPDGSAATGALVQAGGGAQHNNLQPYVVINYCIATTGVFPQRP